MLSVYVHFLLSLSRVFLFQALAQGPAGAATDAGGFACGNALSLVSGPMSTPSDGPFDGSSRGMPVSVVELAREHNRQIEKQRTYETLLEGLRPHFGGRLLDLGAGDGSLTEKLLPHFSEGAAVERLGAAAETLREKGFRNLQVHQADYYDHLTTTNAAPFDAILFSHSLYGDVPSRKRILRTALSRMHPEGTVAIVTNRESGQMGTLGWVKRQVGLQKKMVENADVAKQLVGADPHLQLKEKRFKVEYRTPSRVEMEAVLLDLLPVSVRDNSGQITAVAEALRTPEGDYLLEDTQAVLWLSYRRPAVRPPLLPKGNNPRVPVKKGVSPEVREVFEEIVGFTDSQLRVALLESSSTPPPAELASAIASALELKTPQENARLHSQLAEIYGAVLSMRLNAKPLDTEHAHSLVEHLASALYSKTVPGPHATAIDQVHADRLVVQSRRQIPEGEPPGFYITELLKSLARSTDKTVLSEAEAFIVRDLAASLLASSANSKAYTQHGWLRSKLLAHGVLSPGERDVIVAKVMDALKDHLLEHYDGFEGQTRFAREFRNGSLHAAWTHMRAHLPKDFLKRLRWRGTSPALQADSVEWLRAELLTDFPRFRERYAGPEGFKALVAEHMRGESGGIRPVVRSFLSDAEYRALGWGRSGQYVARLLGPDGAVLDAYRGMGGRKKFLYTLALEQLQKQTPGFPTDRYFRAPAQEALLRQRISSLTLKLYEVPEEVQAKAGWLRGFSPNDLNAAELVHHFKGGDGQVDFVEYAGLRVKDAIPFVRKHYGPETADALGWQTNFMGVDTSREFKRQLVGATGEPVARYQGWSGFQRLLIDRQAKEDLLRTSFRSLFDGATADRFTWDLRNPRSDEWAVAGELLKSGKLPALAAVDTVAKTLSGRRQQLGEQALQRTLREVRFIPERVLEASGHPKQKFVGEAGWKQYAALYHNGSMLSAMHAVSAAVEGKAFETLGWVRPRRFTFPRAIRQEAIEKGWLQLTGSDGQVDPYLQGSLGWLRFRSLKSEWSLEDARQYAQENLAAEEFKSLNWTGSLPPRLGTRAPNPVQDWSQAQTDSVESVLAFVLEHGHLPSTTQAWEQVKQYAEHIGVSIPGL